MTPSLAVIIPTRNAAAPLSRLLSMLTSDRLDLDVIVCDGGSTDRTIDIATRHQVRVTATEGGRGGQMRTGVALANADWVLLLHADSVLPMNWDQMLAEFMVDPDNTERAAYFQFAVDDETAPAQRLERMVNWRCRVLGLPYGDQGLLIARDFLETLGGVPDYPLMEDVALVRRVGKRRLVALDAPLTTSTEKFRRDGYLWRSVKNLFCLALYFLHVPPVWIRRLY